MKRDWNLIKELLLRIECLEFGHHFAPKALAEYCPRVVQDHLRLMHNAGLIACTLEQVGKGEPELAAHRLTAQGQDLLSNIRDSDWRKYSLHDHANTCTQTDLRQMAGGAHDVHS